MNRRKREYFNYFEEKREIMKKRMFLLLSLWMVLILAGCGAKTQMEMAETYASGAANAAVYQEEMAMDAEMKMVSEPEAAIAPDAGTMSGGGVSANASPVAASRKLITEISISMETTEIDLSVATISNAVKTSGGYIQSSSVSGNSINSYNDLRYANLVVRVPQQRLDEFLTVADGAGNILYRSENIQDITLQYTDTEDRIKTLEIEQERLWELLGKAESIESIIALEQRLSQIRYELESFNSQLRTYDNQVDYATIYLDLSEVKIYTPQAKDGIGQRISKGFKENISFVTYGIIDLFVFIITHLPVLTILAVIGMIVWRVAKKKKVILNKGKREENKE